MLTVWIAATHPGSDGVLLVGQHVKVHPELIAGGAGAAFAHHGERGVHGRGDRLETIAAFREALWTATVEEGHYFCPPAIS